MTAPLRMSFDVACSADHAFAVWTAGIGAWWPPDHTMTGRAEEVVLQGGVGGRIYERTADGTEHEWGEVIVWQPPARLGAADEKKPAADGTVEAWGRSADNRVGGWYGLRSGYRGRFGMYLPPLLEELGLAEVSHDARNNRMRAI